MTTDELDRRIITLQDDIGSIMSEIAQIKEILEAVYIQDENALKVKEVEG